MKGKVQKVEIKNEGDFVSIKTPFGFVTVEIKKGIVLTENFQLTGTNKVKSDVEYQGDNVLYTFRMTK